MKHFPDANWLRTQLVSLSFREPEIQRLSTWAFAARKHKPALLAGAGLSLNAIPVADWKTATSNRLIPPKCLTWKELSRRLSAALVGTGEDLETDPLWLAELYEQQFGRNALDLLLREAVPDHLLLPSPIHKYIAQISWATIFTTNYDTLLSREFPGARRTTLCVTDKDLAQGAGGQGTNEVVHLHGRFDRPESIVLTLSDYRRYPSQNPGILAKLRQAMLQHPMLLVGVGATDPNFVQWTGWIEDVLGKSRPQSLSITLGPTSVPRTSFWNNSLFFLSINRDHLEPTFRILRDYLEGIDTGIYVSGLTESFTPGDIKLALENLELALLSLGPTLSSNLRKKRDVFASFIDGLVPTGTPDSDDESDGAKQDQLKFLSAMLGDRFIRFLELHGEHVGPFIDDDEQTSILDYVEIGEPSQTLRLRLSLLDFVLWQTDEPIEARAKSFIPDELDADQHALFMDCVDRALFRKGEFKERYSKTTGSRSPQHLRKLAFFAAMDGDVELAKQHYLSAWTASQSQAEPEHIQLISAKSALMATEHARTESGSVDPIADQLREQLSAFSGIAREWTESHEDALRRASEREKRILTASTTGVVSGSIDLNSVHELEDVWAHPLLAGEAAETLGTLAWAMADYEVALRLLLTYGSERLAPLVRRLYEEGNERSALEKIVQTLLSRGRGKADLLTRLEALALVSSELNESQIGEVGVMLIQLEAKLKENSTRSILRGPSISLRQLSDTIASAKLVILSFGVPSETRKALSALLRAGPQSEVDWAILAKCLRLPWAKWLSEEPDAGDEIDELLQRILLTLITPERRRRFEPEVVLRYASLVEESPAEMLARTRETLAKEFSNLPPLSVAAQSLARALASDETVIAWQQVHSLISVGRSAGHAVDLLSSLVTALEIALDVEPEHSMDLPSFARQLWQSRVRRTRRQRGLYLRLLTAIASTSNGADSWVTLNAMLDETPELACWCGPSFERLDEPRAIKLFERFKSMLAEREGAPMVSQALASRIANSKNSNAFAIELMVALVTMGGSRSLPLTRSVVRGCAVVLDSNPIPTVRELALAAVMLACFDQRAIVRAEAVEALAAIGLGSSIPPVCRPPTERAALVLRLNAMRTSGAA